jgi:malonyl-CoA/methylmalonyl-CoA synthetase
MTAAGSLSSPEISPATLAAWARHMGVSAVEPLSLRRRLGAGTLPAAFSSMARRRAEVPALTIGDSTLRHGELDAAAGVSAAALSVLGSGPGEAVMLIAGTAMSEVVAYLGILRTGAAVVLTNPTSTPTEVERIAAASRAKIVIGAGEGLRACATARLPGVSELVGLGEDDRHNASVLLSEIEAESMGVPDIEPDSPAILAFTSGTTGTPKCAPLSHRNLLASTRGVMWAWRWSGDDHLVHALPISHQHGLSGIHATLLGGSRATIIAHFESDALLGTISNNNASVLFAVPAIHQRLLADLREDAGRLGSLRLVTSGSAPLPIDTARQFEEATGQRIVERYGTTESGLDVSNPYDGDRIPGQVGLPLPGVEISIVDGDGEQVDPGEPGEILVRGPQVFAGYRDEGSDVFLAGWFRTGDDGLIDPASGYLSVVGRRKEMIITGGMNVYPREVEEAIRRAPDVVDVAVVGLPSERWGEEVVAFVMPETLDVEALSAVVARDLAPYKRPKRILPIRELPQSAMGKTDRAKLVEFAVSSGGWMSPSSGI